MKTIRTTEGQESLCFNPNNNTIVSHWKRGLDMPVSTMLDKHGKTLASESGTGYDLEGCNFASIMIDRYGDHLAQLPHMFHFKGDNTKLQTCTALSGVYFNAEKNKIALDGAFGMDAMILVLNVIGLSLNHILTRTLDTDSELNDIEGETIYYITPINKRDLLRVTTLTDGSGV